MASPFLHQNHRDFEGEGKQGSRFKVQGHIDAKRVVKIRLTTLG